MSYNEKLASRIRELLAGEREISEKKMFGGLAFMVRGHMCITTGSQHMMIRIDKADHEKLLKEKGTHEVVMRGHIYKGYVRIDESELSGKLSLAYYVKMALDYNTHLPEK